MIFKYPDKTLDAVSEPAFESLLQREIVSLCAEMRSECWNVGGFAISAIQIGRPYTVLGYYSFKSKEYNWIVDPQIISMSGNVSMTEGCLSIPGYFWNITRPSQVCISYKDLSGHDRVRTFTGVIARAILHEMDHFDGILIPDLMDNDQRVNFIDHYFQEINTEEYKAPELSAF